MERRGRARVALIVALLAVVAVAGAVFAAWWILGERDEPQVSIPSSDSTAPPSARKQSGEVTLPASVDRSLPPMPELTAADRVEVTASRVLRVLVVDAEDVPLAGIPVALGQVGGWVNAETLIARTGRDGIATLRGFERAVESAPVNANWCVYFPFPESKAQVVPVEPLLTQSRPVVLVAPERGRLVVEVVDREGRPVVANGELDLYVAPPEGSDRAEWMKRGRRIRNLKMATGAPPISMPLSAPGELVIDPIAVGVQIYVESRLHEYGSVIVHGPGPSRAGETARLRLELPQHGPVIVGRVVLPDGTPLPPTTLTGLLHDDPVLRVRDGDAVVSVVGTGSGGEFRFDASKLELEPRARPRWLDLLERTDGVIRGRAHAALPVPIEDGVCDVGDLSFELAELLVEGRVVDEQGLGVARARVLVFDGRDAKGDVAPPRHAAIGLASSGQDGAFSITGLLDRAGVGRETAMEIVVVASTDAAESPALRLAAGERDVTMRLRPTGTIEGQVLLDRLDGLYVWLYLRRADEGNADFGSRAQIGNGRFHWDRVPAGLVDVGVGFSEEDILHVVPGVEVVAGKANVDPRLAPLDLRTLLPKFRVEVVDEGGAPLQHGAVTFENLEGRDPTMILVNDGVAELPTRSPQADVTVRAMGYRTARHEKALTPLLVVLEPAPQFRIAIDPPLVPSERHPAVSLVLTLVPAERSIDEPTPVRIGLDAAGAGFVPLVEARRFTIQLEASFDRAIRSNDEDRTNDLLTRWEQSRARFRALTGGHVIDVAESDLGRTISIALGSEARAELLEMVRIAVEAGS